MLTAPDQATRILRESAIVARAITRHEKEALKANRTAEAQAMHRLAVGVARNAMRLTPEIVQGGFLKV